MRGARGRLQGVDAPESDQPHGRAASQALRRMVAGEPEMVETHGRGGLWADHRNRPLRGGDMNAWLVRRGPVWAYDEYLNPGSELPDL